MVARMQIVAVRVHGRKTTARKEAKEQRKVAREAATHAGLVGHMAASCP